MIDWSINLGNLLQIGAFMVASVAFFFAIKADIRVLRHDMHSLRTRQDELNNAVGQLSAILTKVAVQDNRLNAIEEQIRELRHGDGYIAKRAGG